MYGEKRKTFLKIFLAVVALGLSVIVTLLALIFIYLKG